jgi:hypothetical protein
VSVKNYQPRRRVEGSTCTGLLRPWGVGTPRTFVKRSLSTLLLGRNTQEGCRCCHLVERRAGFVYPQHGRSRFWVWLNFLFCWRGGEGGSFDLGG